MTRVKNYLSLIKFSHTIFALPFAFIGFFLGSNNFTGIGQWNLNKAIGWDDFYFENFLWFKLVLIILCMVFARSAAMAFNRYLDRSFDAQNPRTAIREIPAGILKANSVLLFVIFNCLAFVICTWFINPLCFALSFVALFVILFYSYTKRFTPLCHLVLGLGLSLAPIGAYLAVTGAFNLLPLLFSGIVLCWVSGFDIIYALQDEEFDKANNLKSIPAWLGKKKALTVSKVLHVIAASLVILAGIKGGFGWLYYIGAVGFITMLIYQHSLVKPTDLSKVNIAFMTANGIASVVFAIFTITSFFI
jgi:4-hydroxybenzoate polyprenyltransferase